MDSHLAVSLTSLMNLRTPRSWEGTTAATGIATRRDPESCRVAAASDDEDMQCLRAD